jgi:serine/threonine protein kinase
VWSPAEDKELGIVPVGEAIDFQQHTNIARRVVRGMVDGLQYLHSQGIIHRDIRPSNLIMHHADVVIVDFETSVLIDRKTKVTYEGDIYVGQGYCSNLTWIITSPSRRTTSSHAF